MKDKILDRLSILILRVEDVVHWAGGLLAELLMTYPWIWHAWIAFVTVTMTWGAITSAVRHDWFDAAIYAFLLYSAIRRDEDGPWWERWFDDEPDLDPDPSMSNDW